MSMCLTCSKPLKLNSCGTRPKYVFACSGFVSRSISKTVTSPLVLVTREVMMPIVVDLPAPFGPNKAKKSPCSTSRLIPLSALNPLS